MPKALRTFAMLLILVGHARAGEILTPPAPQQPQGVVTEEPPAGGPVPDDAPYILTEIAQGLLAVLPSLL